MPRGIKADPAAISVGMPRAGLAIVLFAAAVLLPACASIAPPASKLPVAAPVGQTAALGALTARLAERDRALTSMRTAAIMSYTAPDRHAKARENITVSRPASLRVEAMSPFGVALIVATHGGELEIFEPSKNKLIRAAATAETLDRFVQIPMAPADAVTLLLGIAPDSEPIAARAPAAVTAENIDATSDATMTIGAWPAADGTMRELGFVDGNLAMVRRRNLVGAIVYEVRYRDYHDIGGVMFPYVVEADFPLAHSHLTFNYDRPIVNGQIPASVFDLTPPGAASGR
ncbi:MAG TPA: hypothetical protein VNF29_00150 [Candidatus Binataceae bacterium]|nr:hypothetical protein [Candidatus Binataceae bacterium]